LFVYGTLSNPKVFHIVLPGSIMLAETGFSCMTVSMSGAAAPNDVVVAEVATAKLTVAVTGTLLLSI
jgi:hypothetical protein